MTSAYILSKIYVFNSSENMNKSEFTRFLIVNIFSAGIVLIVSVMFHDHFFPFFGIIQFSKELSHLIGVMSPIIPSFFAHKYFTFREK